MICIRAILLFLLGAASVFAADSWRSYSDPFPIRSAISYKDGVLLATDGGLRYRTTTEDEIYTSKDGLETTAFHALASSENYVYAVSEYGIVASLEKGKSRWKVLNRSFVNNRVKVLPDMAIAIGDYLIIGFENRVAFFSISRKSSILSIDRIGNISLRDVAPEKLWLKGDSLYIALNGVLFARKMAWQNLEKDIRLVDPDSWTKVGQFQVEPDSAKVLFNGVALNDSALYEKGKKQIKWIIPEGKASAYLLSSERIWFYDGHKIEDISFSIMNFIGEAYEVKPLPSGGAMVASYDGHFARNDGSRWLEGTSVIWKGHSNDVYGTDYDMKVLSMTADGYILYHIWGLGYFLYSNWGATLKREFLPSNSDLCMDRFVENFSVAVSTVVTPDSLGFLTATASGEGYSLVHISLDGKMTCLKHVGGTSVAGPIYVQNSSDGVHWDVLVGTRETPSFTSGGGVEKFKILPPSKNGGIMSVKNKVSVGGLDNTAPTDMSLDKDGNVLWLASSSILGYMELDSDTIRQPTSTNGLKGAEYTSVEVDAHGNVWLGTSNQGVYRLSRKKNSNDTLSVIHFSEKDGLLNDRVSDIALDPVLGMAWFAHENGITVYQRNDLRNAEDMMANSAEADVYAYPNPFRPKIHTHVSIDNIDEQSSVSIFNRGGALIRYFSGADVLGGRADWDGNDKNGKLVTPGVYYYVVKGSSKVKKGKIIVIH